MGLGDHIRITEEQKGKNCLATLCTFSNYSSYIFQDYIG